MKLQPFEWLLAGLNGGHPLAFLSALGTLRTAALAWPDTTPTMRWVAVSGAWRPILLVPGIADDKDVLLTGLNARLKAMAGHPALAVGDNLSFTAKAFRAMGIAAQGQIDTDPTTAAFLGAFACEAVLELKGEQLADTAFRTMRGAGHQHFIKTMRDLVDATTCDHLAASLFGPWRYAETGLSLRLDPEDDRRYALRWNEPSGDPTRTERGANRLAIEALPLFPVQPVRQRLETTGFVSRPRLGTFLSWPIWFGSLNLDIVRSLVALPDLQAAKPPRESLKQRGIIEIYRCQRITLGKFRNFTQATPA